MSPKYLSISDLEMADPREPIWALNSSADSDVGQPGNVHVGIPKANGTKVDPLYLPQTWLPHCLTDQIPRQQLLAASEFRNAVNNQLITLISKEHAQQILQQDGANDERERLAAFKRHIKEATQMRSIADSGAEVISTSQIEESKATGTDPNELDPSFVMFANSLTLKSDTEALNLIRSRGRFKSREFRSLLATLKDKPKVVSFIKEKLAAAKAKKAAA
jgi:hypothetical protein